MDTSCEGSFVTGKIKHMHLINFMTYEKINFVPKEYLNVILGPNGTGKSTLVSAILIGMGGDFQKIGRATQLKDYIKHGQESASIEITLFQNEERETITFTRNISTNGRSEYRLNNRRVDQDRYMASVRRFNIQVDNLCQFLPQDRVQDFALMNPHEILKNTQMSVLPPEVSKQFDKLLEFESFAKNVNDKAANLQAQIASEEATNERLKPVVERMQQRNVITERLKVAQMKQKWLQKQQLEEELQTQKNDSELAANTMKERAQALVPVQGAFASMIKVRAREQKAIEESKRQVDMSKVNMRQLQNRATETENQMEGAANEFLGLVQEIETRKEEQKRLEVERVKVEHDLMVVERESEAEEARFNAQTKTSERQETRQRRNDVLERRNELCERMDSQLKPKVCALESRLGAMRSRADQRLESLRSFDAKLYEAVVWLRQNRDDSMFEGQVYEPMVLELNVRRKEHIVYFENTVSKNDLMAFTCENTNDTVTLHRLLNDHHFRCNVLHSPAADQVTYQPHKPIGALQHLGLHSYLVNLVDAPVPILNYLCKMYGAHNIPVGDERATQNLERIQEEVNSAICYVGHLRMFSKKSVYSEDVVRGTDSIQPRNWLAVGVDESLIEEQERDLRRLKNDLDRMRNQRTKMETELQNLDEKEEQWKKAESAVKAARNKVKTKKMQLTSLRAKIGHLQSLPTSVAEQELVHKRKSKEQMKRLLENNAKQVEKLEEVMRHAQHVRVLQKKLILRDRENSELMRQLETMKNRLDEAKIMYETIRDSLSGIEEQIRSYKSQFAQLAEVESPQARNFRFRPTFNDLPDVLAELQDQIVLLRTQVECMNQDDETLYLQYENRRKLIMELKDALATHQDRRSNVCRDIDELRDKWLPTVQSMVAEVNLNFQRFMRLIDVVGEVELILNAENAFSQFGIGIRVKYRDNGPFLILDRYHHSGGERAVAIATYTLALQKISKVPFRCVDEINQGMDPDNERKVFNMLVDEAAQPGRAQYFFVSPKYQPDVKANRYTTFHIIDSGKYLADTDVFNCSSNSMVLE